MLDGNWPTPQAQLHPLPCRTALLYCPAGPAWSSLCGACGRPSFEFFVLLMSIRSITKTAESCFKSLPFSSSPFAVGKIHESMYCMPLALGLPTYVCYVMSLYAARCRLAIVSYTGLAGTWRRQKGRAGRVVLCSWARSWPRTSAHEVGDAHIGESTDTVGKEGSGLGQGEMSDHREQRVTAGRERLATGVGQRGESPSNKQYRTGR